MRMFISMQKAQSYSQTSEVITAHHQFYYTCMVDRVARLVFQYLRHSLAINLRRTSSSFIFTKGVS